MSQELEQNIRAAVQFHSVSSTGFHTLKCPVCGDKEVRAGFKFEPDKIGYHCFRGKCDASTVYEYGKPIPRKFRHLMDTLGVEIPLELRTVKRHKAFERLNENLYEKHYYKNIELLEQFVEFNPDKHYWLAEQLEERRVKFNVPLYVGTEDQWKNRLIIPTYLGNTLTGWVGYKEKSNKKYMTSSGNSDILFINTKNHWIPDTPIIVEGIMDAAVVPNGIAVLGNTVTKKQAYILRNSKPILVPDRKDSRFIEVAKKYDWTVSVPDWKVKDVNKAVQEYGVYVAARKIHEGIQDNLLQAETRYKLWKT